MATYDDSIATIQAALARTKPELADAKKTLLLLKGAGQNVTLGEQKIATLEKQVKQWEDALRAAGVQVVG